MPAEAGRRPWSLALRVTVLVSLTMATVFAISASLVAHSIEEHFEELDLEELMGVAESLQHAAHGGASPVTLGSQGHMAVAAHHGVTIAFFDSATGDVLQGTAPPALLALAQNTASATVLDRSTLRMWSVGDDTYRGAVIDLGAARALVAVATNVHEHYLRDLRRALWTGVALATLLAMLSVHIAVRWGHAPLRRISATVRGITSDQLHLRLDPRTVPAELAVLVQAFNTMLDELQTSFQRLAHFSTDIAHELRTPVTNLMTQTQVALARDRPASAYREALYSGMDELDRMRKMIGDMLFLAQTENARGALETEPVVIDAEVRRVFDFFEALSEEAGVALELDARVPGAAVVQANRGMVQRALTNLIGNALRHTLKGQAIRVRTLDVAQAVRVEVVNPGTPIGPEHLPHLFDRFYRIDPSRQRSGEGVGLGLAIVRAITEAHGGAVGARAGDGVNVFWFELPKKAAPSPPSPAGPPA